MKQTPHLPVDNDDEPVGRILSRREILKLLGGAGAALILGTGFKNLHISQVTPELTPEATEMAIPNCVVRPAMTEGPYFVDEMLNRSDIRIDPSDDSLVEGMLLNLIFRVFDVTDGTCKPLVGAQVDVWHCDARGVYSGVTDRSFDTTGQKWLRGYQITDEAGIAKFITIYPGWYSGRTVHIHFKIRINEESNTSYEFTSQLFFDEDLSDIVLAQAPYASKGYRDTLNTDDGIYQANGAELLLDIVPLEDLAADAEAGYTTTFDIAIDMNQEQTGSGMGGGRNRP